MFRFESFFYNLQLFKRRWIKLKGRMERRETAIELHLNRCL